MKKEKPETPIWLAALTRAKNKEYLKGEKGDILVCGLDSSQQWCEETKCEYCGRICYYTPDNIDLVKENAKKICPICALEKHSDDMPEEFKRIFRKIVGDL